MGSRASMPWPASLAPYSLHLIHGIMGRLGLRNTKPEYEVVVKAPDIGLAGRGVSFNVEAKVLL